MDDPNPTKQQVIALSHALASESQRVSRWAITCFLFAIAVSALVAATKSGVFLGVALFAWFFAWNRWKLSRFLLSFLPAPNEDEESWVNHVVTALHNSPTWYRYSERTAALFFLASFALITVEVTSTSGFLMRLLLLYAVCWLVLISSIVVWARNTHRKREHTSERIPKLAIYPLLTH